MYFFSILILPPCIMYNDFSCLWLAHFFFFHFLHFYLAHFNSKDTTGSISAYSIIFLGWYSFLPSQSEQSLRLWIALNLRTQRWAPYSWLVSIYSPPPTLPTQRWAPFSFFFHFVFFHFLHCLLADFDSKGTSGYISAYSITSWTVFGFLPFSRPFEVRFLKFLHRFEALFQVFLPVTYVVYTGMPPMPTRPL